MAYKDFKWCNNCSRQNCPHPDSVKISGGCLFFEFFNPKDLSLMLKIKTGEAKIPQEFVR